MDSSNCSVSGVHYSDIENVICMRFSKAPYQKRSSETMWEEIVGRKMLECQNAEDARRRLQKLIRPSERTLVLLVDVCSMANLGNLVFEAPRLKIVTTTRDGFAIPRSLCTTLYELPLLIRNYAISMHCEPHAALENAKKWISQGKPMSHNRRERILKFLKIITYGEPHAALENTKKRISQGKPMSHNRIERILKFLKIITDLDDFGRECFLDLASFPAGKKICADALLDIWVYVRKMDKQNAHILLRELARRDLLKLTGNQGSQETIPYESASELFFTQRAVVRDIALHFGCQDSPVHTKRLLMSTEDHSLPEEWELLSEIPLNAQIVSLHTGSMAENDWNEMNLPETEALVLHFSAIEFFLPPFLETMKKLKVLIVCNLGSERATIKGLDALSSLTQLRSVRLERLVAPTIPKQSKLLQNLDKLCLSLCEGFVKMSTFNDSNLREFSLDHCSDLDELPPALCHMPSAQTWSVTNCHLVEKLPNNLGNLSFLKVLRLSALAGLKELPASIGKLEQLEFLDISLCEGLKELPDEIGQLKKLEVIDMRECSRLRRLPRSVCGLSSLKHVICDEKIGNQWLRAKAFHIPDLRVEIVEPQFTLDWLED